ncbi:hypothetical protein [Xanthomonas phage pXoo2107]|nr:hypothetical protein [Xanthomonas phage XPV2]AVO24358.1 hypothetical protein [Xanthomonas phage XPV3]UUR56235.1 hypothetical protein [Xanthomonas phage pXoo2107]
MNWTFVASSDRNEVVEYDQGIPYVLDDDTQAKAAAARYHIARNLAERNERDRPSLDDEWDV